MIRSLNSYSKSRFVPLVRSISSKGYILPRPNTATCLSNHGHSTNALNHSIRFQARGYATIPPHAFPAPNNRRLKPKNILFSLFLFSTGAYIFWKVYTHNNYPPAVAEKLRQALFAEIKEDYVTALKYYLEALQEADKIRGVVATTTSEPEFPRGVDSTLGVPGTNAYNSASEFAKKGPPKGIKFYLPTDDIFYISDEYTGILLKIAEMYTKVNLPKDALHVYRELNQAYVYALHANLVPDDMRMHILRRDLLVALQTVYIEAHSQPAMTRFSLLVHLSIAQNELVKLHPELDELFKTEFYPIAPANNDAGKSSEQLARLMVGEPGAAALPARKVSFNITFDTSDTQAAIDRRNEASKLWEPIRAEFFAMRQLFSTLSAAIGDPGIAVESSLNTTKWMVAAGFPLYDCMLSLYMAGAYMYIQAQEIEAKRWKAEYAEKVKQGKAKDVDEFGNKLDLKTQLKNDLDTPFFPPPPPKSLASESLKGALFSFEGVLNTIKNMPGKTRRSNEMAELQALSTYSLGVIALHENDLTKADDLLKEARLRAKGCGYDILVDQADIELATLEDLKKANETGDKEAFYNGLYNRQVPTSVIDVRLVPVDQDIEMSLSELSKS